MNKFTAWLIASAAFAPALAQTALPQVDLGYQIQQASSFNVRSCHTSLPLRQLTLHSKLGKYTTLATSATDNLPLEICVLRLLWHRPVGILR
jgi:hypothetical protein